MKTIYSSIRMVMSAAKDVSYTNAMNTNNLIITV